MIRSCFVRGVVILAGLALTSGVWAQNRHVSANPEAPQSNAVVVPSTNIYVVGSGIYGTGVYVAPPAVSSAEPTPVGISLASQSGISLNQPVELGAGGSYAPYNAGYYGASGYAGYGSASAEPGETAARVKDLTPSRPAELSSGGAAPAVSLGEIAAQYKSNGSHSVRAFTNADAEQLTNRVSVTGAAPTASETSPGAQREMAQPPPEPAQSEPPRAPEENQELAANAMPQIPQNAPPQNTVMLPATASWLPLLVLLGVTSVGTGLLLFKILR